MSASAPAQRPAAFPVTVAALPLPLPLSPSLVGHGTSEPHADGAQGSTTLVVEHMGHPYPLNVHSTTTTPSHGDSSVDDASYSYPPPPHAFFGLTMDPPQHDDSASAATFTSISSQCFPPPSAYLTHSALSPFALSQHAYTHHYDEHDLELELLAFHQHQRELPALDAFPTALATPSAIPLLSALAPNVADREGHHHPTSGSPQPFLSDPPPPQSAPVSEPKTTVNAPAASATKPSRTKSTSTSKRKPPPNASPLADPSATSPVITPRSTTATALGPDAAQHVSKNRGQRWSEHELATLRAGVAKHGRNFVAIYNDHGPNGKVDTALARIPSVRAIHAKWLRLTMVERQLAKSQAKGAAELDDGQSSEPANVKPDAPVVVGDGSVTVSQ